MISLCIETSDQFGSVAVRVNGQSVGMALHPGTEDYSSWLIPAVDGLLKQTGKTFGELNLLAVATGPGSFTAVRVGLCTVKAWAEVFGKRVVGVSRLEAMARSAAADGWVAASYDAHRNQVFAGLYRRAAGSLQLIEEQMVIAPDEFVAFVKKQAGEEAVQWVSIQPEIIAGGELGKLLSPSQNRFIQCERGLANAIGELAEEKAARGEFTDVLSLDANYVRRSDAEIYWKGSSYRVS